MEGSWFVVAGRCSLYLFFLLVGVSLVAIRHRCVTRLGSEPTTAAASLWPSRWFLQYVGNIDEGEAAAGDAPGRERRRNLPARVLMAHIMEDLARRQTPELQTQQAVEELRESVRAVEPEQAG